MASKNSANHVHRYKKMNIAAYGNPAYYVYKCMKPTCSHYTPTALAEGKLCECNRCGEPMIIGKQVMNQSSGKPMTLPHCGECTKKRKTNDAESIEALAEFLDGALDRTKA
jgi:hypothetical protein